MPLRFLPLTTLLAVLVLAAPARAVVGGVPTPRSEAPWLVALIDAEEGRRTVAAGQFCAATLIRPDALVTAAHCVEDEEGYGAEPDDLRIFAGKVLPLRKGVLRRVRRIEVNPTFDDGAGQANADIAVLRLATPMRGVPVVRLPTARDGGIWRAGAMLTLFGWGNRAPGEGEQNFPRQLHQGDVMRMTDVRCDDLYGRFYNAASQLCAGRDDGAVDACQGDSGGPLIARRPDGTPVLAGVVSYGEGCGEPRFPTVYTKVERHLRFIARALARD
jgi:secreted trypsin-like serine protease